MRQAGRTGHAAGAQDRPPPPAIEPVACDGTCNPRWRWPWVPIIRPIVLLFFAGFFLIVGVGLGAGMPTAAVGGVLALILGVPGAWIILHPFSIRRRMAGVRPGSGSRVPVTVEVAGADQLTLRTAFVQQPTVLRLRDREGVPWLARLRPGSVGGRGSIKRGNPWLVPGDVSQASAPGELVLHAGPTGRLGLVLHRPTRVPAQPLRKLPGPGNRQLAFGGDPGECLGLYISGPLIRET